MTREKSAGMFPSKTVADLIEILQDLPPDAIVIGRDHKGQMYVLQDVAPDYGVFRDPEGRPRISDDIDGIEYYIGEPEESQVFEAEYKPSPAAYFNFFDL